MDRSAEVNSVQRPLALLVDGDPAITETLRRCSFDVTEARGIFAALERLELDPIRLVLVAGGPAGTSFDPLIERVTSRTPATMLLLPEPDEAETGLEWIRRGVFDLLPAGAPAERIEQLLERGRRQIQLFDDLRRKMGPSGEAEVAVVGNSSGIQRLRADLSRLATREGSVWLYGEKGSGRELAARHLHALSTRRDGPFVTVHCEALAQGPRESFWSQNGAGAGGRRGPFEQASGGTLYLDGVTDLALEAQEGLEQALDRGPGGDVRLVASSDRPARQTIETGRLPATLVKRLSESSVVVPSLRSRREDIAALARHMAGRICELNNMPPIEFSSAAVAILERYAWPGNVRELREAIEHAAILAIDGTLREADLPSRLLGPGSAELAREAPAAPLSAREFRAAKREVVDAFEAAYLRELLERHSGNVTAASQQAGMLRSALQRLLRKHALRSADFRQVRARKASDSVTPGAESTL